MRECLRVHACEGPDARVRASPPATLLADAFPVANPARPVRQCTDVPTCSTYDAECKCTACESGYRLTPDGTCDVVSGGQAGETARLSRQDGCRQAAAQTPGLAHRFPICLQCSDIPKCSTYDAGCKCTACTTGVPVTGGSQCVSA